MSKSSRAHLPRYLQHCYGIVKNRLYDYRDPLADKAATKAKIQERQENGFIAIVNSGMDCDCSRWDNRVSIVKADLHSVTKWIDSFYDYAEGPQSHYLAKPSEAKKLKSSSRDLALEAYEDGHSHVVYY